jgi:hypothetical protein
MIHLQHFSPIHGDLPYERFNPINLWMTKPLQLTIVVEKINEGIKFNSIPFNLYLQFFLI